MAQPEAAIILIPSQGSPQQSMLNSLLSCGKESRENKHKLDFPMSRRAEKQTSQTWRRNKNTCLSLSIFWAECAATSGEQAEDPALADTKPMQGVKGYSSTSEAQEKQKHRRGSGLAAQWRQLNPSAIRVLNASREVKRLKQEQSLNYLRTLQPTPRAASRVTSLRNSPPPWREPPCRVAAKDCSPAPTASVPVWGQSSAQALLWKEEFLSPTSTRAAGSMPRTHQPWNVSRVSWHSVSLLHRVRCCTEICVFPGTVLGRGCRPVLYFHTAPLDEFQWYQKMVCLCWPIHLIFKSSQIKVSNLLLPMFY